MRIGSTNAMADPGKKFVLTDYGYSRTPEAVKKERKIGKPITGFEQKVPVSWIEKGYVEED
ncbi:hypothetical protein [Sellimonas catena]|uniref:Uncharacterized protein n=1 Tax=Sellimonas catena TaxID=2994035 RepID=A0A9W6C9D2_9FIRM|nr:hypothetical protein [Sellimonas catena]GLG89146.1 hypothetical protein Selli2_05730 [Sellimonas catena]